MWTDLKYALRSLLKSPGFTAVAVITLALGIGANTAIFSLLNATLMRSLPVPDPQQLRTINWMGTESDVREMNLGFIGISTPAGADGRKKYALFAQSIYEPMRERARGFSEIFAFMPVGATVAAHGPASSVDGMLVSGNFFEGYGAKALLGRTLTHADEQAGAAPVAVITYRFWERAFGLDPLALGKTITLNNLSCVIVGILPSGFAGPLLGDPSEFYVPLSLRAQMVRQMSFMSAPGAWVLRIMARLAPGADERQAKASLEVLFSRALQSSGKEKLIGRLQIALDKGHRGPLDTTLEQEKLARPMFVLMIGVGLLLLVACANLASLLLARAAALEHEMAVRAAIGAGRWRLLRQPLLESLLLSLAGAAAGLLLAIAGRTVARSFFEGRFAGGAHFEVPLDLRVLGFVFAVSLLTAVLFGIFPALRGSRVDPVSGLKSASRHGRAQLRMGKALVVVQVGLSVVLLVGAGLLARTFANLSRIDPGIDAENLLLFRVAPNQAGYDEQRTLEFFDAVRRSVAAIPGVRAAALSDIPPLGVMLVMVNSISIPGGEQRQSVNVHTVGESFFSTMGIALLRGRDFSVADTPASQPVAVVNEAFVRRYFSNRNPIGQTFHAAHGDPTVYRIVGVVRDSRLHDVRMDIRPLMYLSFRQSPSIGMMFGMAYVVRSVLPPLSLVPAIRRTVAAIDPKVAVDQVDTQQKLIDKLSSKERLLAIFGGFVGAMAALLAGIGLFGLLAYTVSRRTGEIGVRMALGARQTDVVRLVVGQGVALVAAGLLVGTACALWATKLLRGFLWGVEAADPPTLIAAAVLLCLVAAAACLVPARRAAKVDPLVALRAQ